MAHYPKDFFQDPYRFGHILCALTEFHSYLEKSSSLRNSQLSTIIDKAYRYQLSPKRRGFLRVKIRDNVKFILHFSKEKWGERTVGDGMKYKTYADLGNAALAARNEMIRDAANVEIQEGENRFRQETQARPSEFGTEGVAREQEGDAEGPVEKQAGEQAGKKTKRKRKTELELLLRK